jgi:hypothetical protein
MIIHNSSFTHHHTKLRILRLSKKNKKWLITFHLYIAPNLSLFSIAQFLPIHSSYKIGLCLTGATWFVDHIYTHRICLIHMLDFQYIFLQYLIYVCPIFGTLYFSC